MSKNTSNKVGSTFENKLTKVFDKYRNEGKAYIIKVPTDWVVIRKPGGRISTAYPKQKSNCLDYIGFLPNESPIVFEAKSTKNKTSFPLSNIAEYQYALTEELYNYINNVFYIIEFREHNEVYLVAAKEIIEFKNNNDRKSIPYNEFRNIGILMEDLDILKYIKKVI